MNDDNNIELILLMILVLRSMAQSPTEAKNDALGVCTNTSKERFKRGVLSTDGEFLKDII